LSHHGRPVQFQGERSGTYWQARTKWWRSNGIWDPMEAIAEISRWSERAFPSAFASEVAPLPANPAFHHRFAGLLMLADWLGSHSDWFPVERVDLEQRMYQNAARIPALLESVGIDVSRQRAVLAGAPSTF